MKKDKFKKINSELTKSLKNLEFQNNIDELRKKGLLTDMFIARSLLFTIYYMYLNNRQVEIYTYFDRQKEFILEDAEELSDDEKESVCQSITIYQNFLSDFINEQNKKNKAGIIMSLNKEDVCADLWYALDELERPPQNINSRLIEAADLDAQSEDEFHKRLLLIGTLAYSKAAARSDVRNAHEAIEKGKAILIDSGRSVDEVKSRRHNLHRLLTDIQQLNSTAFKELERCFNSTIQYLESVTTLRHKNKHC